MTTNLKQFIREQTIKLGFGAVGFAAAGPSKSFAAFQQWLAKGYGAEMHYLARHSVLRADPRNLAPAAKTIIVAAARYPSENNDCLISNYARGADYHDVLRSKLEQLANAINEKRGSSVSARICVDTAPLLEREWAVRAGIGWIGKQGSIVNPEMGTCFFLGELLVDIELEPDAPPANQCGACRLCVEACPTKTIMPDNRIDARRCVSYLTIEHKKDFSAETAALVNCSVFGCDRCTVVCPWNRHSKAPVMEEFYFSTLSMPTLEECRTLDQKGFKKKFGNTPVAHIGLEQFKRNINVVMANTKKTLEIRNQMSAADL